MACGTTLFIYKKKCRIAVMHEVRLGNRSLRINTITETSSGPYVCYGAVHMVRSGDYCTSTVWWLLCKYSLVAIVHVRSGGYCTSIVWWLLYKYGRVAIVRIRSGGYFTSTVW